MIEEERDHGALAKAVAEVATGADRVAALRRAAGPAVAAIRGAGARAVLTGRWLADLAIEVAPRIPVRDAVMLAAHHGGRTGDELAAELVRSASMATAALGAAAGAVMGAEALVPPAWVAIPAELVVQTAAVAAIEMKLIAELHEAIGVPVAGDPKQRAIAVATAWARGRAASAEAEGAAGLLGDSGRRELRRMLERRLARRTARNLSELAPFLVGAAVGAEVNRRATRRLGEAVLRDLARRAPSRIE